MKTIKAALAWILLPLIMVIIYFIQTEVDPSKHGLFWFLRVVTLGGLYLYFYLMLPRKRLIKFFGVKLKAKHYHKYTIANFIWFFLSIIVVGVMNEITAEIHGHLLEQQSLSARAIIRNCYGSRGTSYCVYRYRINERDYQKRFRNVEYRLKEADTVGIRYYVSNPAISKIDDRYKQNE